MATERLRSAIDGPLAGLGLSVQDLTVTPVGRRRVLRVVVDRDLSGLSVRDTTSLVPPLRLDEVAAATRSVTDVLDSTGLMGEQSYVLEVTSPGVDRPLRGRHQFRRNVGRLVTVVTEGGHSCTGRILAVSADEVEIETATEPRTAPGTPGRHPAPRAVRRTLAIADICSAVVQVEFTPLGGGFGQPVDDVEETS